MNKIMLIGNLGKDPEMNYTPGGVALTKFSLAVNRVTKSSTGEKQEETSGSISSFGASLQRYAIHTCIKVRKSISREDSNSASIPTKMVSSAG